MKKKSKLKSTIEISENSFSCNQVNISRTCHELTDLMDCKTQIRVCEDEIMESANHTSILMRIRKHRTFSRNKPKVCSTRKSSGLRSMHIMSKKKVLQHI